jgi:hypothetical protein
MAEIDKPLPNVNVTDEAFVETEVETPIEDNVKREDVEVTMDEEGGAEISFDPSTGPLQSTDHFQNLWMTKILMSLAQVYLTNIQNTKSLEETGNSLTEKV